MGTLQNARHETFAQNLAKGMSASKAYREAGYKPNDQNAARLTRNDEVRDRIAELQGSTAKQITDVRDAARQHTQAAVDTLALVMHDPKAPHTARVAAANGLLDRGHGKAVQHIEADVNVYDSLGFDQKVALLEALDMLDGDEDGASDESTRH